MSNYDDILGLSMPLHQDPSWTDEINFNWAAMGKFIAPDDCYFVSPGFTTANLYQSTAPSDRRHFDTMQGAITAAQSADSTDRKTILAYPGNYYENIVIDGNVTIAAFFDPMYEGLGGGQSVYISGSTTVAGPTVTINPDGVGIGSVNLINLCLQNRYNQDNATQIDAAYLINITKPGTYDSHVAIGMKNCPCRMQTWGRHNLWKYGIRAEGYGRLTMDNCNMMAWGHSGGDNDGGIIRLVSLYGDHGNGEDFTFYAKNSNFYSQFLGAGLLLPRIFDTDNGVVGIVGRSGWDMNAGVTLVTYGGTGTNVISGLEGTDPADYMNTPDICLAWL